MILPGAVIILITAPFLFAQDNPFQDHLLKIPTLSLHRSQSFNISGSTINPADTTATLKSSKTDKRFRMKKSPTVAVLLSAVLPGAGQFYNRSYWKIPIIAGFVGYFGYEFFRENNLYRDYRDSYINSQTEVNPEGDLSLKSLREFYRNQRDDFVWYFMVVYIINLVDAYVDAHLFDFDIKDEKLIRFGKTDRNYRLKLNLRF